MKYIAAIVIGLLYGAFIVIWAILFSGGGDGWNGGFRYGMVSLLTCPMVAVALSGRTMIHSACALAALIMGLITDINLINSIQDEYKYFQKVSWFAIPWIGLMLSWQILAFIAIFINYISAHNNALKSGTP